MEIEPVSLALHPKPEEEPISSKQDVDVPRASYPPVVESAVTLGYLTDTNGFKYGRENGRCFTLGGRTYLTFGDSRVKYNDVHIRYMALNAVAVVRDESKPLESSYLSFQENGIVNPLITEIDGENNFTKKYRICLWSFGGAVETSPGEGFMWYEIMEIVSSTEQGTYWGIGMAKLKVKNDTGDLEATRCKDLAFESCSNRLGKEPLAKLLMFELDEPRFGSFSCLLEGDFIYLWGSILDRVYLARVEKEKPTIRDAYRYWDGSAYVEDIKAATPVLEQINYGSFFKSSLFGEERPWVFVGNSDKSCAVMMGAEKHLEGPWKLHSVHYATDHWGLRGATNNVSFIFAHPWASNEEAGEIFFTCSERYPGGTLGARIKLAMENSLK